MHYLSSVIIEAKSSSSKIPQKSRFENELLFHFFNLSAKNAD